MSEEILNLIGSGILIPIIIVGMYIIGYFVKEKEIARKIKRDIAKIGEKKNGSR